MRDLVDVRVRTGGERREANGVSDGKVEIARR
jgi:hypothetical protein